MTFNVIVRGGTNAGWRKIATKAAWSCRDCEQYNPKHWTKCPRCGKDRP